MHVVHRIDSLDLVNELIGAGLGVALLPRNLASRPAVTVLPLSDPPVRLRAFAVTRRGRDQWPPLRSLLHHLETAAR